MNIDQLDNLTKFRDEIHFYLGELFEKIDEKLISVLNPQVFLYNIKYDIEQEDFIFKNATKSLTDEYIDQVFKQDKTKLTQEFLNKFCTFRIYSSKKNFSLQINDCTVYIFVKIDEANILENNKHFFDELISRFFRISRLYFLSYINNDDSIHIQGMQDISSSA